MADLYTYVATLEAQLDQARAGQVELGTADAQLRDGKTSSTAYDDRPRPPEPEPPEPT